MEAWPSTGSPLVAQAHLDAWVTISCFLCTRQVTFSAEMRNQTLIPYPEAWAKIHISREPAGLSEQGMVQANCPLNNWFLRLWWNRTAFGRIQYSELSGPPHWLADVSTRTPADPIRVLKHQPPIFNLKLHPTWWSNYSWVKWVNGF